LLSVIFTPLDRLSEVIEQRAIPTQLYENFRPAFQKARPKDAISQLNFHFNACQFKIRCNQIYEYFFICFNAAHIKKNIFLSPGSLHLVKTGSLGTVINPNTQNFLAYNTTLKDSL